MFIRKFFVLLVFAASFCMLLRYAESKSVKNNFHSDAIVTHWREPDPKSAVGVEGENEPGFLRRQLLRFGEAVSSVGNAMGAHATKITSAVDRVCEIVKTVIPLLAAICHVGQFGFCAATNDAPGRLESALHPVEGDLNIPD